jgi:hypothetical protein
LRSSHGISTTAISGEGTGMERDYDFTSAPHASDLDSPTTVGRKAGERAVARFNPRKVETCKVPWCSIRALPARSSAIWSVPSTAPRSRARPAS